MTAAPSWLDRFGLGRKELRAWAMYDWANSAYVTTVVAAVFPIYFAEVAAAGMPRADATVRFSITTTITLTIAALLAPPLGTVADRAGAKLRFLRISTAVGVLSAAALVLVGKGDWALGAALFAVGNLALSTSSVFYDALLPHIARPDEVHRVSTAGYALGYIGGGVLLALNLACIQWPTRFGLPDAGVAVRVSFVVVAVWWLGFAIPLLRRGEPAGPVAAAHPVSLVRTLRDLRRYPQAMLMLIAFLLYNDGIGTIIRMATIYGTELGLGSGAMIGALLVTQFVGVPFAFLFGALGSRIGAKRAVFLGLALYLIITVLAYFMRTGAHFFALAFLVGTVQGGTQALSRSLFATLIPAEKSGEFFGFFAVAEKFAGIFGPAVFGLMTALTGTSRNAILSVGLFFILGAGVLSRVDVEAGHRAVKPAA